MHLRVLAAALGLLLCAPIQSQQTADPAPLPDIQTLLARVRTRYDALESLRKTYICTLTQVADDFSSTGAKKTHTNQYQVFYVRNVQIQQLLARDGQPLPPDEARKIQEQTDKLVEQLKTHEVKPAKNSIVLSASNLLKVATFTHPRRELLNGRPTLVFDYHGDPHAPAPNLGDQIMRLLAGTLWVDEQDSAILRLNGSLQQNFHVAGGLLVNIKKGSWFDFHQTRINNEIWFPQDFTAHVDGRFLLLKGFNGDAHDTFTDYRKLKTSVTILPGAQPVDDTTPTIPERP